MVKLYEIIRKSFRFPKLYVFYLVVPNSPTMKHAICYISTATTNFEDGQADDLLNQWKEKNAGKDIKGILLFSEGHFFQVLEGEKEVVLTLFQKIKNDGRHSSVIQVLGKDIKEGSYDDYVVENLTRENYSRPELIKEYCESVKGMDAQTQQQIKIILQSFIDTQVL